jgi:RNA polymerase sigma factor (sigma-70 family)
MNPDCSLPSPMRREGWRSDLTAEPPNESSSAAGDIFATTRWTLVIEAGRRSAPQADQALEELCRAYWFPLYAYIRRRGHSKEDAEDLTQAFFVRFLEKNYLEGLSAERGRFRAFLLASMKHFLANEWDRAQRIKRGGQIAHLSLDWQSADAQFQVAGPAGLNPEHAYDREWAVALLGRVLDRLRDECVAEGRSKQFEALKVFLTAGKGVIPYTSAAASMGIDEGAARTAVHRLRKRYRTLLRDEIGQTLASPAQVDEEMKVLFGAFAV